MRKLLFITALMLSSKVYADEFDETIEVEPPCAHASLKGQWIGPDSEMTFDESCKASMGDLQFDYDSSSSFKRGADKCKVFQKANEIVVDCGKDEVERYHRYNEVVHK